MTDDTPLQQAELDAQVVDIEALEKNVEDLDTERCGASHHGAAGRCTNEPEYWAWATKNEMVPLCEKHAQPGVSVRCPYCGDSVFVAYGPTRRCEIDHCGQWLVVDLETGKAGKMGYEDEMDGEEQEREAATDGGTQPCPRCGSEDVEYEMAGRSFNDCDFSEGATLPPGTKLPDGGVPTQTGSHYDEVARDSDDLTRYERAHGMIRRCRYGEKYCTWSQRYEGERLDELLKPSGCINADKVDRRCPLCGGGVEEELYHDNGEAVEVV